MELGPKVNETYPYPPFNKRTAKTIGKGQKLQQQDF